MTETSERTVLPIELITPDLAKQYLKNNSICNKELNKAQVDILVEKINDGKWDPNGDAIYFGHGNILLNGQHRMHAIIQSNTPVFLHVFRIPTED